MYNLIEMQNKLKGLSKEQLMQVLKSGSVPQYMVVSELNRRKNMESDQARREATEGANTVTQEVINAIGVPQSGIAQLASAMNAQTDNTQNTGVMQMATGGIAKMQTAGKPKDALEELNKQAVAELKRLYPEVYEQYKDNPRELLYIARQMMEVAEDPERTGLEELETPRTTFQQIMDFARYSPLKGRKNMEKIEKGATDRDLQARQETIQRLRDRDKFYIGADPIFQEGLPNEKLKGTVVPVPLAEDPLKFRPPNNMSGPSVAMDRPLNMANMSQPELGPMFPSVSSNRPPAQPTNLPVNIAPPFTSMLPSVSQGDVSVGGKPKENITRSLLAGKNPFETGVPLELQAAAATDLNRRAREFYNTDTYTPPEMIYSGDIRDILKREEATPEEIQAASNRLATEAAADEAAKTQASLANLTENNTEGLGPDAAAALREGALRTLRDQMQPTLVEGVNIPEREPYGINAVPFPFTDKSLGEVIVDSGESAIKGVGKAFEYGKELPIGEAVTQIGGDIASLYNKGKPYLLDRGSLIANQISSDVGSLYKYLTGDTVNPTDRQIDAATGKFDASKPSADEDSAKTKTEIDPTQAALNKIIENQQKQAEASNMSLSKYLENLERDREFTKAMALVEAGAGLMEASPTFGEGVSKSLKRGNKALREGLNSYNKNKLAVLALGARIDAAKAAASARAGIAGAQLQTAALSAERDTLLDDLKLLEMQIDPDKPDPKQLDKLRRLQKQVTDLNNQIRTASGLATLASVGADGGNIFGSYDVTKTG